MWHIPPVPPCICMLSSGVKFAASDPYTAVDGYAYRVIQEERSVLRGDGIGIFEKNCLYENVSKS